MSVTFERDGEALHAVFRCETCGRYACFGENVHLRQAIERRDPKAAGRWWCARRADGSGYCAAAPAVVGPAVADDLFGRVA